MHQTEMFEQNSAELPHCSERVNVYVPRFEGKNLLLNTMRKVSEKAFEIDSEDVHVGEKLGEGAFGSVTKGMWRGKPCVIKMLKKNDGDDASEVEYNCLLVEIGILTEIGAHPNLVAFHGACLRDAHTPMIIQEYIEGPNLQEHLDTKRFGFNLGKAAVSIRLTHMSTKHIASKLFFFD
jgi:serine/threonine protein kinase